MNQPGNLDRGGLGRMALLATIVLGAVVINVALSPAVGWIDSDTQIRRTAHLQR